MTHLTYKQAQSNPCHNCRAGCCTYLPLKDVQITNIMELDHLYYLLHFEGIEILLVDGYTWRVHYNAKCNYLTENNLCSIHNSPQKPKICTSYNPYHCFYKPAFLHEESPQYVRFNLARFIFFREQMQFDSDRNITSIPNITEIRHLLPPFNEKPPQIQSTPVVPEILKNNISNQQAQNPCSNCPSYCCTTLQFPIDTPTNISNFDYLRFCTGFPNVFVTLHENQWSVNVKSTCMNYNATTTPYHCDVFGKEERPLQCSLYNELTCSYKKRYISGQELPSFVLQHEHITIFEELCSFDSIGNITDVPDIYSLRNVIENKDSSHFL